MSGFVYIWFDKKKKMYYIGSHWGSPDDEYVCSSRWMKSSYRRRPHDFRRRILSMKNDRRGLLREEERWLEMIEDDDLGNRYYNLTKRTGHWHAGKDTLSIRDRISLGTKRAMNEKNIMSRPDVRKKLDEAVKNGYGWSEERRKRQRESMKKAISKQDVWPKNSKSVVIDGVEYPSQIAAQRSLGISRGKLLKRLETE